MQNRNQIRGLSLTRPWPFAFVNGPVQYQKRIENRSWEVPQSLRESYIALHAAKSWDEGDREFISEVLDMPMPSKSEHPDSQIFAVCRVRLCVGTQDYRIRDEQRRWAFGPVCWIVEDFLELNQPIACLGAQGLWTFEKRQSELDELRRVYQATIAEQRARAATY